MDPLEALADEDYCYLETTGRRRRRPHTIEIWFAAQGGRLYLLAGGGEGADWVRNLRADPRVRVRVGARTWTANGRVVHDPAEDALARRLLAAKYQRWQEGQPMSRWAATGLPIAIEPQALSDPRPPAPAPRPPPV